jgi:hypothetical protein
MFLFWEGEQNRNGEMGGGKKKAIWKNKTQRMLYIIKRNTI